MNCKIPKTEILNWAAIFNTPPRFWVFHIFNGQFMIHAYIEYVHFICPLLKPDQSRLMLPPYNCTAKDFINQFSRFFYSRTATVSISSIFSANGVSLLRGTRTMVGLHPFLFLFGLHLENTLAHFTIKIVKEMAKSMIVT